MNEVWVMTVLDGYNTIQWYVICKTKKKAEEMLEEFESQDNPDDAYAEIDCIKVIE